VGNNWNRVEFVQVVLELEPKCSYSSGSSSQWGESDWCRAAAVQGDNSGLLMRRCSFTGGLMETSGDLGFLSLSLSSLSLCVLSSQRQAHSNGYLWDLTPGTSEALQVYCHHVLLFLLHLLHYFFHFFGKAVRSSRTNLTFDSR